ncbi:hypothetical protein NMY22_g5715 [Coprinellus aureogranulatus]|nr:hypothetical protein NMY22_g5715 [Coprinellus aureogranulatus]
MSLGPSLFTDGGVGSAWLCCVPESWDFAGVARADVELSSSDESRWVLRKNPFTLQDLPVLHAAYEQCLGSEREAQSDQEVMHARCLGYFLTELPTPGGKSFVAEDIALCEGDRDAMSSLAQLYIDYVIHLFKRYRGETASSHHHGQPPFDEDSDFYSSKVEPAPKDFKAARRAALERDGRAAKVGVERLRRYSYESLPHLSTLDELGARVERAGFTQGMILYFILRQGGGLALIQVTHAEHLRDLINALCGIQVVEELSGGNIHRLANGLTMAMHVHLEFDSLNLWFEEVSDHPPHTYIVRKVRSVLAVPNTPVTFTSTSPLLELPDPRYLKFHAAVCRIAQMSGVAEYLEKRDSDLEYMTVLDESGDSGELLESRLRDLALAVR